MHRQARQLGLTRIETLVVIGVLGLLLIIFFLLPVFGQRRDKMAHMQCLDNLRELGAAVYLYADDHDARLPSAEREPSNPVNSTNPLPCICELLTNYVDMSQQPFFCPGDKGPRGQPPSYYIREGTSYEWNYKNNGRSVEDMTAQGGVGEIPLMYDYENFHRGPAGPSKNILLGDGRAEPLMKPRAPGRPPPAK